MDAASWIVWGAWALVFVAFVAIILLTVALIQRLRPLQRAAERLQQRIEKGQEIAGKLQSSSR